MADVLIIGDGPAGLSAALFLAKNGQRVTVFGQDSTPMHKAMLYNYLGIPEMTGSEFQRVSRAQVQQQGGQIEDVEVTHAEKTDTGFAINGQIFVDQRPVNAVARRRNLVGISRFDRRRLQSGRNSTEIKCPSMVTTISLP